LRLLGTLGVDLGLTPNRLQVVVFRWPITVGRSHMTFIDAINDTWFRPESNSGTSLKTSPAIGKSLAEWITAGQPRTAEDNRRGQVATYGRVRRTVSR
jgi:glycine/D-amino acid oxidase-like deaminating enzyme